MNNYAIQTESLSKEYPGVIAVNQIDLKVERGEIYGFLGLNGAGKTTTIRALLGMIKPSFGKIYILGQSVGDQNVGPWHKVGHMVEAPSAYPELTVVENLQIAARLQRLNSPERIDSLIEQLNLEPYRGRKAGLLSTGNLQRLGLARALLHEPELLLLDEPTNGLDPAGVVEIRNLLQTLAHKQGLTVFMSSHILSEVDRLADKIGIIHNGVLIEEYSAEQLESLRSRRLAVMVRDTEAGAKILEEAGYTIDLIEGEIHISDSKAIQSPEDVATLLVKATNPPLKLAVEQEDLEEHFLRLTGGHR